MMLFLKTILKEEFKVIIYKYARLLNKAGLLRTQPYM
jgi:hypothetical protein